MRGKVIGKVAKKWRGRRPAKHPLAYIDRRGRAMAAPSGKKVPKKKHIDLGGDRVSSEKLKERKALKKIFYVTKAGNITEKPSGLRNRSRRRKRKSVRRKARRKTTSRRRRKTRPMFKASRKCPTVRKRATRKGSVKRISKRAAVACLRNRKPGRPSKKDRALYRLAERKLGGKKRARKLVRRKKRRTTRSRRRR